MRTILARLQRKTITCYLHWEWLPNLEDYDDFVNTKINKSLNQK